MKPDHPTVSLPQGVARIVIADGRVQAQMAPELAERGPALGIGGALVRMQPTGPAEPQAQGEFRPAFAAPLLAPRPEGAEPLPCEVSVNGIPQWGLPGRKTVQIKFLDPAAPCRVALAAPIPLPAQNPQDPPLSFRAWLASHRAAGRLEIRRLRTAGDKTKGDRLAGTYTLLFDDTRIGGQDEADYLAVEQQLPPMEEVTELHMTVQFDSYKGGDSQLSPFLFTADPHVARPAPRSDTLAGRADRPGPSPGEGLQLKGAEPGPGAVWLEAELPAMTAPGQPLMLYLGEDEHLLLDGADLSVTITEDHGHSLQMKATRPGLYRIMLDGKFAFSQQLGPDPVWVRMPREMQTGHYHNLAVLDESGTQRLLSTYVLMPRMLTPLDVLQNESRAPFPGPLMPQAAHRYAALRAHMAAGASPEMQAQVARALEVVEGGHDNVRLAPLAFPPVEAPDVSVVIPAHNKVEVTYLALASLLLAHNHVTFEVILVDDGSTDETARIEEIVSGITVVRNTQAQRFIRACNAGAAKARGTYVALLNNDVEVTNGWLDALVDGFARFDKVGLVGSKLLYPDGRLQDAGGIIWSTGNPWNYGHGENPWDPRFCYARQTDYLCGAALMTTRAIWEEVGGLSQYLEPMYFEDTDLAFKVREAGYTTWFIPSSVVYHYEGLTSGTDTAAGFKRYQEINRPKFKRRWAAAYSRFGAEGVKPDLEKDRGIVGRVLFIDYATPRPDRDAGSHAAVQEIRLVQSLGYKVTFLARNLAHMGSYTEALEKMGVEMIHAPFFLSVDEYLSRHVSDFDAFYITRFYVARDVIDRLRQLAPRTRILFNNADLHFLRELRAGIAANDAAKIAAARETRTLELEVMRKSDVVLSYNEVEHSVIQSHTDGQVRVAKCPWVVDMPDTAPGLENRSGLSFLGNYLHAPNAEGVLWFARQVMPLLETSQPDLQFFVYGSGMGDDIRALKSPRIHPQGYIREISDAYDKHRIFVAPLLSGAGIKGKVLAALAHGVPCVLTPTAAEGVGLRHGHDCMIATTPVEWRDAITRLQGDDALWQAISDNARTYVRQSFSFETGRELMRAAFESIDLYSPVS